MEEITIAHNGQVIHGSLAQLSSDTLIIISPGYMMTRNTPVIQKSLTYLQTMGASLYIYDSLSYAGKPFFQKIAPLYTEKLGELVTIVNFFRKKYRYKNIILMGVSLGALITVAASKLVDISGIILLNGFLNVHKQIKTFYIYAFIFNLFYKKRARLNIEFYETYVSPKNVRSPVIILHGTSDSLLNHIYSEEFYNALEIENKKLHLVPNADHILSREDNMETMTNLIINWLKQNKFV